MALRVFAYSLVFFFASVTPLATRSNLQACPLLGQQYPAPTKLRHEPKLQAAGKLIDAKLEKNVKTSPYNEFSFSVGMFSTTDDGLIYQYHHTSPGVKNSPFGTNEIDADSIYRVGSISKLLTAYLFLINEGDRRFNDPIVEYIPELKEYVANSTNGPTADWKAITVGDLLSALGGVTTDYGLLDLSTSIDLLPKPVRKAFPKVPKSDEIACGWLSADGSFVGCSADQYIAGAAVEAPVFQTAITPVYSNIGYTFLGIALSRITGKSLEDVFDESLVKPLNLKGTSYATPNPMTNNDIIAAPNKSLIPVTGWNNEFRASSPAGGYFSSTNDLATIGKAILSSQQLSKAVTNRWLKPTSFVEDITQAVGRPWEIFRLKIHGHSVDIYTKEGDWSSYHTLLAVIPSYNIGFTVNTAQDIGGTASGDALLFGGIPDFLFSTMLPVIDDIAKEQAARNFAGHYTSSQGNSSLTLSTSGPYPGLSVTHWSSNGVDMLAAIQDLPQVGTPNITWRIMPNQLYSGDKVGFTSFYDSATPPVPDGEWYWPCQGWVFVDDLTYGNVPLGQMVFDVDKDGVATSVDLRGLRETLQKSP